MADSEPRHILWRNEFSIGFEEIDTQHKRLLALLNNLNSLVLDETAQHAQSDPLLRMLEELNEYAVTHFQAEEVLMHNHLKDDDEHLAGHLVAHRTYWTIIVSLKHRYFKGDTKIYKELLKYLNQWWINHIRQTDQEMGRRLRLNGAK